MELVRGTALDTSLTGTLYAPEDDPPAFSGAATDEAPFVFVCDAFYEVATGGVAQEIGDRTVRIAFEKPVSQGFVSRERALEQARDHVRTQFARLGVDPEAVDVAVEPVPDAGQTPQRSRS